MSKANGVASSSASKSFNQFDFEGIPDGTFEDDFVFGNHVHNPGPSTVPSKSTSRFWNSRDEAKYVVSPLDSGTGRSGKEEAAFDIVGKPQTTAKASFYSQMDTVTPEQYGTNIEFKQLPQKLQERKANASSSSSSMPLAPIFKSTAVANKALTAANKPISASPTNLFKKTLSSSSGLGKPNVSYVPKTRMPNGKAGSAASHAAAAAKTKAAAASAVEMDADYFGDEIEGEAFVKDSIALGDHDTDEEDEIVPPELTMKDGPYEPKSGDEEASEEDAISQASDTQIQQEIDDLAPVTHPTRPRLAKLKGLKSIDQHSKSLLIACAAFVYESS